MNRACPSRYGRPQRGPAAAMMAAHAHRSKAGRNAPHGLRNHAESRDSPDRERPRAVASEIGSIMKVPGLARLSARPAYALVAVALAAAALARLQSFVPAETLTALRSFIPGGTPVFQLLLLGWFGVALGRLTVEPQPSAVPRSGQAAARRETAVKEEKVERILRQIAKVLQKHMTDSESFSDRLDGANERLSQQHSVGPVKDIVLALIDDNRDMRDKLSNVRDQLEESRLQVMQLQTNLERSEEAGLRDVVTAIGNRRFFDACFADEVEKAQRAGDNFCLALADIDRFKHVNDRFGHLVGDRLLRLFATILVQNVRGQDKVARFGGEEFALMFPGARLDEAVSAVERIRGVLEMKQWTVEPSGERVGKVTASFGVARLSADESATDLLRRVDQLLYEAKVKGRNRVAAGDEDDGAPSSTRPSRDRRAATG
jgi:diguanylate cyclase